MCIRDRVNDAPYGAITSYITVPAASYILDVTPAAGSPIVCLLYTSDAADERSSVDLGGRRIIKKKIEYYSRKDCQQRR